MRRIIRTFLLLFLLAPGAAGAQQPPAAAQQPAAAPEVTSPDYIALLYHKLSRQAPDFKVWAEKEQQDPERLKQAYVLLSTAEPVVVETPVKLSTYNSASQGFFIQNFRRSTFFPSSFQGRSYALVPQGIIDKQWMRVDDPVTAKALDDAAKATPERILRARLVLDPQYADASGAAEIDGVAYWPIAVSVRRIVIYAQDGKVLWQSDGGSAADEQRRRLLNLYK